MTTRSRIEIINQILEVANGCFTKTEIMYKAFLDYAQAKEYVRILTERELITYDPTVGTFKTTEKGLRFLQIYKEIGNVISKEKEQRQQQQHHLQIRLQREKQDKHMEERENLYSNEYDMAF